MTNKFLGMRNWNTLFMGALLLSIGTIFNSCEDETKRDITFEGYGDMFIQQKKVNDQILYAPYYYIHSNVSMNSVDVETPDGATVELKPFEYLNTYIEEPNDDEFTTSMMPTGLYHFTGTYGDNETFDITDIFDGRVVGLPQIDSLAYDETDFSIYVSWELVAGADLYKVKLVDQTGRIVFNGIELTAESNAFKIELNNAGWTNTPFKGDVFTLQLHAYAFDGNASQNTWVYNIECDSYSEAEVVWGE